MPAAHKCFSCKAKISLVELTIGGCKCGNTFCSKHRMPEMHTCSYNHKVLEPVKLPEAIVAPKMVKI